MRSRLRLCIALEVAVLAFGASASETLAQSGRTRTYHIAADEVAWDYAPSGTNRITGQPFGNLENIWMESGPDRIGRVYRKALYREYIDDTFTELKPRRGVGAPGVPRPADPRRSGGYDRGGLPEQRELPGQRAPARRVL